MSNLRNNEAKLKSLLAAGSVPRSACGRGFLEFIAPLLATGVLAEERLAGGRTLVVCEAAALAEYVRRQFPDAPIAADEPDRVAGIAEVRDSKDPPCDTLEIVHVRAWRDEALTLDGAPVNAATATNTHGVFSFLLRRTRESAYALHGICALVKSPTEFQNFEQVGLKADCVIYAEGQASQKFLRWLGEQCAPDFSLIHVPDIANEDENGRPLC